MRFLFINYSVFFQFNKVFNLKKFLITLGSVLVFLWLISRFKIINGFFVYISFNTLYFLDNYFCMIKAIPPLVLWGFIFLFFGSFWGVFVATKKFKLKPQFKIYCILAIVLFGTIFGIISQPTNYAFSNITYANPQVNDIEYNQPPVDYSSNSQVSNSSNETQSVNSNNNSSEANNQNVNQNTNTNVSSGSESQCKYPQASQRILTDADLSGMSKYDLKIMRNEIFARHGYIFKTPEMKSYFSAQSWYNGQYSDVSSMLTSIESQNIAFIKRYE